MLSRTLPSGGHPIEFLKDRLASAQLRLSKAAEKSGRSGDSVRLLAVTKTLPAEMVQAAIDLGLTEIAENRVQEASLKKPALQGVSKLHLVGQLQRNKARKAVELFDLIQSVDSPRIAEALDRVSGEMEKKQRCLIEVKISKEETKSGLPWTEAGGFISGFAKTYPHLELKGLMAVGPLVETVDNLHQLYRKFSNFFQENRSRFGDDPILSLGMSDDFEIAVEEGSTMVRLGRILFGERSHI